MQPSTVAFFFKENLKCLCFLWKQEAKSVNGARCRFQRTQGGVQSIWVHLWKEGMFYSPEQCRTGCLHRPAHGGEGEDVLPQKGCSTPQAKPPCSSCCLPRRVKCNSGQHTQVQLCFPFGKTTPDSIEPFLKQATYQIDSP